MSAGFLPIHGHHVTQSGFALLEPPELRASWPLPPPPRHNSWGEHCHGLSVPFLPFCLPSPKAPCLAEELPAEWDSVLPGQRYSMTTINLDPKATFVYDWVGRANGFASSSAK